MASAVASHTCAFCCYGGTCLACCLSSFDGSQAFAFCCHGGRGTVLQVDPPLVDYTLVRAVVMAAGSGPAMPPPDLNKEKKFY